MFKYYNHQLINQHRSYNIEQVCALFKAKNLHPQTVRGWVQSGELEVIIKKPIVIHGGVLKVFLMNRNAKHKKELTFEQFKCLACQEITLPQYNIISVYKNKNGSVQAVANCSLCHATIRRFYKQNDYQKLEETFIIQQLDSVTLCNMSSSTSMTHLDSTTNDGLNEPSNSESDTS